MNTASLAERALLVSCTITQFSNLRTSAASLAKVRTVVAVREGDTYVQSLLPYEKVKEIKLAERELRKTLASFTLPWLSGLRILPAERILEFSDVFGKVKDEFTKSVETVAAVYDDLLSEERTKRGNDFNQAVYPINAQAFRETCSVQLVLMPLPNLEDFRLTLSAEAAELMQQESQEAFDQLLQDEHAEQFLFWYDAHQDTGSQRTLTSLHIAAGKLEKVAPLLSSEVQSKLKEVIGYPKKLN